MADSVPRLLPGFLSLPLSGARTPGPLGVFDQADPQICTLLGDTPGPLGWLDGAAPWLTGLGRTPALMTPVGPMPVAAGAAPSVALAPPMAVAITAKQLKTVFTQGSDELMGQVIAEIGRDPKGFGLDTKLRLAHFFAQVREEAGAGLQGKVENLNYKAEVLKTLFGYYKRNPDEADQDGRLTDPKTKKVTQAASQETIGNKAYANRNGNGDVASGDGYRFRGRGFIQVTGRGNYKALNEQYQALYGAGEGDFEKNPELLESFPYTLRSAICFWVGHDLQKKADVGATGDVVDTITAVINKNTPTYEDRRENFEKTNAAFAD